MEVNNLTLGQKIKRFRLVNDIRQEDMAEKLGVSRATLINYEKGHTKITLDALEKLKQVFPEFTLEDNKAVKPKIIEDNVIDFSLIFKILSKNVKFIFFTAILVALSGTAFSYMMKKQYTAKITLYPAKNDGIQGINQLQALAMNFGINSSQSDQSFNISDVVKSRLIAEKSIKKVWKSSFGDEISLVDLWDLKKEPFFKFSSKKSLSDDIIEEKAIRKFEKHIFVSEDRLTGLITITTELEDQLIVASLANFVGKQIQNYIQKENSAQTTKEKLFILDRLRIVKKELESSEFDLKEFKESNMGYEDSPELFMIFSRLFREAEAKKEVYLTLQQQLELARIEEVRQSPILHILDSAAIPMTKSSPNRLIYLIISAIAGVIFSSFIVLFKY